MPAGILYWIVLILWIISMLAFPVYHTYVIILLFVILGWKNFGPPIQ